MHNKQFGFGRVVCADRCVLWHGICEEGVP